MTWVELPTHNVNDWFKHKLYVKHDHRLSGKVRGEKWKKVLLPTHHQSTRPTYWASRSVIWLGLCCQDEWIQVDARLVGPWPQDIHSNMEAGRRTGHTEEAAQDSHRYEEEREEEEERLNLLPPDSQWSNREETGDTSWQLVVNRNKTQCESRAVPSAVKQTRLFIYCISILYTFISSYRS